MILQIFTAGAVLLFLISLHYMWEATKQDIHDIIERDIILDYNRCENAMRFCAWSDTEAVIDDFEARWKPYVSKSTLDHYIGRLIECQLQKEAN